MKKFILLIALLCFIPSAHADLDEVVGVTIAGGEPCPSWYASAIFSWDGDHPSGTDYGCETDGDAIQGTNSSLEISQSYGETGTYAAKMDSNDEYLTWVDSGGQYIDVDVAQTICFRAYFSDQAVDGKITYFEAEAETNHYVFMKMSNLNTITYGYYKAGAGQAWATYSEGDCTGSWLDVCYSWEAARPDGDSSITINGGGAWSEDVDSIDWDMNDPNDITLGENVVASDTPDGVEYVYIDHFAILSGYEQSPPW